MRTDVPGKVAEYYSQKLAEHGATPRGVDWNSADSQAVRFRELLRVCESTTATLGDYGCGYGALLPIVRQRGFTGTFRGYDVATPMIDAAKSLHAADILAQFDTAETVLAGSAYVVASGVFNVKLDTPIVEWEAYVLATIERLYALSEVAFAFNCLTGYSDADRKRPDLYYPEPAMMFDHCVRRFGRHVQLSHDYGLYEFTIHVRRQPRGITP